MERQKRFLLFFLLLSCTHTADKAGSKLVPFEQDERWGYKNESGQVVIQPQFILANDFLVEGIATVLVPRQINSFIFLEI